MITDSTFAKSSIFSKMMDGGNTGKGRVERMSCMKLKFTRFQQ